MPLLLLLAVALPASAPAQVLTIESAVRELFGGEIVIGEVPEVVSSSIPLLMAVDVVAAHVNGDRFSVVLSSRRDVTSLALEYSQVLAELGWKAARTDSRAPATDELSFCSPQDAFVRIRPEVRRNAVTAHVEFEPAAGFCKMVRSLRASLSQRPQNLALQLLRDVEPAPGCTTPAGGGSSQAGRRFGSNAWTKCELGVQALSEHYEKRWRELGWTRRIEDEAAGHRLSTWEVPVVEGRRWHAVFLVSSGGEGSGGLDLSLSLTAFSDGERPD